MFKVIFFGPEHVLNKKEATNIRFVSYFECNGTAIFWLPWVIRDNRLYIYPPTSNLSQDCKWRQPTKNGYPVPSDINAVFFVQKVTFNLIILI